MRCETSSPSSHSIARYGSPSCVVPVARSFTMPGCSSDERTRAPRRQRPATPGGSPPSSTSTGGGGMMPSATCTQFPPPPPGGNIIPVTPADAGNLQSLAFNAQDGDTLLLDDGTYHLAGSYMQFVHGAALRSKSGDPSKVIIDGDWQSSEDIQIAASN